MSTNLLIVVNLKKTRILIKPQALKQVCESDIAVDTNTIITVPLENVWMVVVGMD